MRCSFTPGSIVLEDLENLRADLVAFRIRIGRQAHQDVARAAEGLHLRACDAGLGQRGAQLLDIRRLREIRLDHHAAGEIDAQIQVRASPPSASEATIKNADNPYHTLRVCMNGKRVTL